MKLFVCSDIFIQVKPKTLDSLKEKVDNASKYAIYPPPVFHEKYVLYYTRFTNQEVYNFLSKAVNIIKNTEEHMAYTLETLFCSNKQSKPYAVPPGTIRIFSKDLVCFYNGKTWRKLSL